MPNLILFYRLIVRPLRREPVRTSLTAAAVALGVAVVLAIELAGGAAAGSFRASVESLTGEADFEITATGGVPARVLAQIEALPYAFQARPRIEDYAEIAGANRTVPLIGVMTSGLVGGETGSRETMAVTEHPVSTAIVIVLAARHQAERIWLYSSSGGMDRNVSSVLCVRAWAGRHRQT